MVRVGDPFRQSKSALGFVPVGRQPEFRFRGRDGEKSPRLDRIPRRRGVPPLHDHRRRSPISPDGIDQGNRRTTLQQPFLTGRLFQEFISGVPLLSAGLGVPLVGSHSLDAGPEGVGDLLRGQGPIVEPGFVHRPSPVPAEDNPDPAPVKDLKR